MSRDGATVTLRVASVAPFGIARARCNRYLDGQDGEIVMRSPGPMPPRDFLHEGRHVLLEWYGPTSGDCFQKPGVSKLVAGRIHRLPDTDIAVGSGPGREASTVRTRGSRSWESGFPQHIIGTRTPHRFLRFVLFPQPTTKGSGCDDRHLTVD